MIEVFYTTKEKAIRNAENRDMLKTNAKIYIRKSFDKAVVAMEAESWIMIAKEQGFTALAAEMEADLQHELETA
jgi:phosphohistidine swiveling domain-containing protein